MKIKPIGERLLVKPKEAETKTKSGLVIPETAQEKTSEAIVVEIGEKSEDYSFNKKDHILYDKYAGTKVVVDGQEMLIIGYDEVLAKIEE
ncbi:MAG: co-chaperone GroES [Alkalispirochaetaceae bacterium]